MSYQDEILEAIADKDREKLDAILDEMTQTAREIGHDPLLTEGALLQLRVTFQQAAGSKLTRQEQIEAEIKKSEKGL